MVRVQTGPPTPTSPCSASSDHRQTPFLRRSRTEYPSQGLQTGLTAISPEPDPNSPDILQASLPVLDISLRNPSGPASEEDSSSISIVQDVNSGVLAADQSNSMILSNLRNLMTENQMLKDALSTSNVSIKEQLLNLAQWRHRNQVRFRESKDEIKRLKSIIEELKKDKEGKESKTASSSKESAKDKKKEKEKDKKNQKEQKQVTENVVVNEEGNENATKNEASAAAREEAASSANESSHEKTDATDQDQMISALKKKAETLETCAKKAVDELRERAAKQEALEKEVQSLKAENELLQSRNESLAAEKWELSALNTDLKNKLQQSMAMSMVKEGNDAMLQEEVQKMQVALAEERKVTEKLSRNLELEKRKVESLEQRAKSMNKSSGGDSSLPDEVRLRDELLATSIEKYRMHCEHLADSLEECDEKLASFEIKEEYHVEDLRKELSLVKRILSDEKRRSAFESQKLDDSQTMFGRIFKDYMSTIETMKQVNQRKLQEAQKALSEPKENSGQVEKLNADLHRAEAQLREERVQVRMLEEKIRQMELDIEAIPILKAQVEVYQADFNAEREAREKIAGDKADLEEELRKMQQKLNEGARNDYGGSSVRNRVVQMNEAGGWNDRPKQEATGGCLQCPSCDETFAQLEPLEAHVNRCIDKNH